MLNSNTAVITQSAETADTKSVRISIDRQGAVYLGEEDIVCGYFNPVYANNYVHHLNLVSWSSPIVQLLRSYLSTWWTIEWVVPKMGVITDKENG